MRAVSIRQPWASLLAAGGTRYSVRSWRTTYRGRIAIFSANKLTEELIDLCLYPEFRELLSRAGYDYVVELPLQAILGTASLLECVHIGSTDPARFDPADPARRFDSFYPEHWAWVFADARPFPRPIPFPGKLGVFAIPDHILEARNGEPRTEKEE